jgi:hypothetical protein
VNRRGERCSLEELLLRHAVGEDVADWRPPQEGSAVMMVPIPREGIYRGVEGVDQAAAVQRVTEVRITAKLDQVLAPLPEGATYLGFIFARAATPSEAEAAVREAHGRLRFRIERTVPMA